MPVPQMGRSPGLGAGGAGRAWSSQGARSSLPVGFFPAESRSPQLGKQRLSPAYGKNQTGTIPAVILFLTSDLCLPRNHSLVFN